MFEMKRPVWLGHSNKTVANISIIKPKMQMYEITDLVHPYWSDFD